MFADLAIVLLSVLASRSPALGGGIEWPDLLAVSADGRKLQAKATGQLV